jgi:glycogen operon protein
MVEQEELGITAVELLPVFQFDPQDSSPGLVNYWGYSPVSFFAPHQGYSSRKDPLEVLDEFRDMVKALHKAGIEVSWTWSTTTRARGTSWGHGHVPRRDNASYYRLSSEDRRFYEDFTGCGNTLNMRHPRVLQMVMDSLRYWALEMHVDGFRFDLASILGRGQDGEVLPNPPLLERIAAEPVLANTKLIAEAWDAAGLYQVGTFPNWGRWADAGDSAQPCRR